MAYWLDPMAKMNSKVIVAVIPLYPPNGLVHRQTDGQCPTERYILKKCSLMYVRILYTNFL